MRINCTLPGHENEWIERKDRISVGEWKRWTNSTAQELEAEITQLVKHWELIGADGNPVPQPCEPDAINALDLPVLPWLIDAITQSMVEAFTLPKAKSGASAST